MRMSDTFGKSTSAKDINPQALTVLVDAVKVEGWKAVFDSHNISTRAAGKSCCEFLYKTFGSLEEAITVLKVIHEELPNVNVELIMTPDGMRDNGYGPASYRMADWQTTMAYLPLKGFGVTLLVDVKNLCENTAL